MSKEVKRYNPLLGVARNAKLRRMDMQCDPQWVLDLAAERDALLAERDRLAKHLTAVIRYLDTGDMRDLNMIEARAALQGAQP